MALRKRQIFLMIHINTEILCNYLSLFENLPSEIYGKDWNTCQESSQRSNDKDLELEKYSRDLELYHTHREEYIIQHSNEMEIFLYLCFAIVYFLPDIKST